MSALLKCAACDQWAARLSRRVITCGHCQIAYYAPAKDLPARTGHRDEGRHR